MTPESKLEATIALNLEMVDRKTDGGMNYLLANLPKQYVFCELTKDSGEFLYFHSKKQIPKSYKNEEFGMCVFEIVNEGSRHKIISVNYVLAITESGAAIKPLKDAPHMSPQALEIIQKTIERYNSR